MIGALVIGSAYVAVLVGATMACEVLADLLSAAIRRRNGE